MGLDIAIYLLREGTDLDGSVLNDKIGAEYEEVTTHEDADFDIPHVCYIVDWGVVDKMCTARLFFGHEERELSDLSGDAVWAAADELLSTVDDLVPSKIKPPRPARRAHRSPRTWRRSGFER